MKPKFNDYPLLDIVKQADERIETLRQQGVEAYVQQKWTCGHCGARQTMEDRNTFHLSGRCEECSAITPIKKCNYLLVVTQT